MAIMTSKATWLCL